MSTIIGPKARLCRMYGINLFASPKYDKILAKRQTAPGMHKKKPGIKLSEYGSQLHAKQIARIMYALSEKQFGNYITKAINQKGNSGENIVRLLECRIDNVILKAGFAKTIFQARQMVNHGHFSLNMKKVYTPSIQVKINDIILFNNPKKSEKLFNFSKKPIDKKQKQIPAPSWLRVDQKEGRVEIASLPVLENFDPIIDINSIIEFYSR